MDGLRFVSKKISEKPIILPGSPFWNVFRRFGRDELIALIISVVGTFIASFFITSALILSLIGPVIEKIGFFPAHFKEALDIYKTTPKKQRKSLFSYFKKAMKEGSTSFAEDILIHDPLYIGFMFAGLVLYPSVPVWIMATFSFIIAVFIVSALEIWYVEFRYFMFKKKLKRMGFGIHPYYEARFMIGSSESPVKVINKISKEFNLGRVQKLHYHDLYLDNKLDFYSGRRPKLKLRKRHSDNGKGWTQTVQIVYTRPREMVNSLDQYRYFPNKREKIYFELNQKMPWNIKDIKDEKVRNYLKSIQRKGFAHKLSFIRNVAHNNELLVSTDHIIRRRKFYLLEIKVYKDVNLLREVMRYVMREFPVVQITHGKFEIDNGA